MPRDRKPTRRNRETEVIRDVEVDDNRPRILQAVSYGQRTYLPADPDHGRKRGEESELAKVIRAEDIPRLKKLGAIAGNWRGATGVERQELDEAEWNARPEWERKEMLRRGTAPSFVLANPTA